MQVALRPRVITVGLHIHGDNGERRKAFRNDYRVGTTQIGRKRFKVAGLQVNKWKNRSTSWRKRANLKLTHAGVVIKIIGGENYVWGKGKTTKR